MTTADIKPKNPRLLTEKDVDYSYFHCCGDEDLIFLRCASCAHVWVDCTECSTWFTDLGDLSRVASSCTSSEQEPLSCPGCEERFEDSRYLLSDRYLATAAQVIAAGHGRFLSEELRARHGVDES